MVAIAELVTATGWQEWFANNAGVLDLVLGQVFGKPRLEPGASGIADHLEEARPGCLECGLVGELGAEVTSDVVCFVSGQHYRIRWVAALVVPVLRLEDQKNLPLPLPPSSSVWAANHRGVESPSRAGVCAKPETTTAAAATWTVQGTGTGRARNPAVIPICSAGFRPESGDDSRLRFSTSSVSSCARDDGRPVIVDLIPALGVTYPRPDQFLDRLSRSTQCWPRAVWYESISTCSHRSN